MRPRVLALAGMVQSLKLVRQIAETGHADTGSQRIVLDSVFRIDADSVDAVYGGSGQLRHGLLTMRDHLVDRSGDEMLPKLGMSILQIERRFVGDEGMTGQVIDGLRRLEATAQRQGSIHPDVIGRLGQLYADTISHLRPKVIVQGNPHYLQQPEVVAEIRALLLAALRSAVLWRQVGGSYWDFVFRRRAMMQVVEEELG
ncbi:MAG: high frequency lysogenization protein HflD [Lysobacter sp.]|nr:high frequency lysogenization protein HflD [Lysobacter sp.]